MEDSRFMLRCIDLARRSGSANQPNPMVGAVIVYNNRVIGEGFHHKYGGPHAEIIALQSVQPEDAPLLPESVLYVSLEPCSHHGKTPPCANEVIRSGIRKVVIGTPDPNPMVAGRGISKLKEAGIEVIISAWEKDAGELLRPFLAHLQKRPYIILKCVKSKENFMGKPGEFVWLSNQLSKVVSHYWRSRTNAILTGKNTVLTDNPELTTRWVEGNNPVRVLIDPDLECMQNCKIFSLPGEVIVFNHHEDSTIGHIRRIKIQPGEFFERDMLHCLFSLQVYQLLIEGGAFTLESFIKKGLWDEARVINTPVLLREGVPAPDITGYLAQTTQLGDNQLHVIHRESLFPVPHQISL